MNSKPKLIILSGPLGIGKSTIAKKYVENHPMSLNLDIDELRKNIGSWRERAEQSAKQSKVLAEEMARVHLAAGYDVIIPQIYRFPEHLDRLEAITNETNAELFEIVLYADKEEAIDRFMKRGGIHPGGLIDKGGGVDKLNSMHDEMTNLLEQRPGHIKIYPEYGDIDGTYSTLLEIIETEAS